jgi:hypothetical protein
MKFFASKSVYNEAGLNGHWLEHEMEHAEVIYEYVRDFCLNEQIRDYNSMPAKITVLLPDSDNVKCIFEKIHHDSSMSTLILMGKPDIIDAYSISGKKLDKSIVRNISLTDYSAPIKEMFREYKIDVRFTEIDHILATKLRNLIEI